MKVLLVTYYYPPDVSVGAVRWPPLVRALRERGHEVTVLSTSAFGTLPDGVVRTRDLEAPGLARKLLRRPEAPTTAGGAAARAGSAPPRLLTQGPVPDAKAVGWVPFVIPALRRLVREQRPEVIITNGPPDSTHLAPLALPAKGPGHLTGRPGLLLDLEDGWRFEPQRDGWPTRAQDRLDASLEARVFRAADAISSLTRPVLEDAATRYGLPGFFVPIAIPEGVRSAHPTFPLDGDAINVVHTGALSHAQRRDPRALLAALKLLPDGSRARIVLAGGLTDADRALLEAAPPGRIVHLGVLSNADALALQRAADALLLFTTGPQRSTVTGKLFEYLGAERPILAVTPDNEGARIVRETGTGVVVDPADPAAVARALDAEVPYAPRGLDAYRLPAVVDALEEALRACLTSRP